jgi:hypothetical protein
MLTDQREGFKISLSGACGAAGPFRVVSTRAATVDPAMGCARTTTVRGFIEPVLEPPTNGPLERRRSRGQRNPSDYLGERLATVLKFTAIQFQREVRAPTTTIAGNKRRGARSPAE